MRKRILFADDSIHELRALTLELAFRGITVEFCSDADACWTTLQQDSDYDLVFLDVMLAPSVEIPNSKYNSNNTNNFVQTGLTLARDIRDSHKSLPIVFFTNAVSYSLIASIERAVDSIGNATVLYKRDFPDPSSFGDLVESMIEAGVEATPQKTFVKWLSEVVILQPNIAGLGIDLQKLFAPLFKGRKQKTGEQDADGNPH